MKLTRRFRTVFASVTVVIAAASLSACSKDSSPATSAESAATTTESAATTTKSAAAATETVAETVAETAAAGDTMALLTGSGEATWFLVSRSENGAPAKAVDCAKDDLLIFKKGGKFDSVIAGTKCNPAEVEVKDGDFALSADRKVIAFTVPGFSYTGTLTTATPDRIVIEFDLGTGSKITDEFILRR
jgi:hypothetical protein